MPRGDGTGPEGQGPMTGRGMGRCGGDTDRRPNSRRPGRGAGRGQGGGQARGLGQRIATGFNNLRQRARGGNGRPKGGRRRNSAR
jgi:hypothetical protein